MQIIVLSIFGAIIFLILVGIWLFFTIEMRREFNSLKAIEKGTAADKLKNVDISPLIIQLDEKTKFYCFARRSWRGFIFGGTKTIYIVFTVENNIIKYINYED